MFWKDFVEFHLFSAFRFQFLVTDGILFIMYFYSFRQLKCSGLRITSLHLLMRMIWTRLYGSLFVCEVEFMANCILCLFIFFGNFLGDFISLQQYLENRLKYLAVQKAEGRNPYPHKFFVTMSLDEYIKEYGGLSEGQHLEDVSVSLSGSQQFLHR